jgi:hypothetical protein
MLDPAAAAEQLAADREKLDKMRDEERAKLAAK